MEKVVEKKDGHYDKPQKRKRSKDTLACGNFRGYYKYRLGNIDKKLSIEVKEEDPRLEFLKSEWFEGKKCLDVGCNEGNFTIDIGRKFSPAYILGIDIDSELIRRARENLRDCIAKRVLNPPFTINQNNDSNIDSAKTEEVTDELPISFRTWTLPRNSITSSTMLGKSANGLSFPFNVVFKEEDVCTGNITGNAYDTISMFSVSKWIHLFHGDDGLQKVFQTVYDNLLPGGKFVFEPQPWRSYHKRKFTSDSTLENYNKIQMRPKEFSSYLLNFVGFKSVDFVKVVKTSTSRFRRPIYVYIK